MVRREQHDKTASLPTLASPQEQPRRKTLVGRLPKYTGEGEGEESGGTEYGERKRKGEKMRGRERGRRWGWDGRPGRWRREGRRWMGRKGERSDERGEVEEGGK